MADVPQPRSYQQILTDIVSAFEATFGINTLAVGSPLLRIFEATAQSDFRSSNDIFALLRAQDLNQASGQALQLIAASEDIIPISESSSSGVVQISDTSFVKKSTKIYQGMSAPIVGSTTIFVQDASLFTPTGSIYIGRGTVDFEGPLAYSATSNLGTFWSITLTAPTQKFHNIGESVVLAQGGDRILNAGTVVQTPQGNAQSSVQFQTLYQAVIPDGETTVQNVQVVAITPGLVGNVSAGAISQFSATPFSGASVTNLTPLTNANATESQEALRERIRNTRQSRTQGTPLAITTGVIGVTSTAENKRVTSASVVSRAGAPTTLYIDDGTGYEELDAGIAFETLIASALGGEQYFTVAATPPIAKAFVTSSIIAPFNLTDGCALSVILSGITYTHFFSADEFRSISNASAFEVIASINGDPTFPISARTADSATKVVLFAKQDTDETIQVTSPAPGSVNANLFFGFPITPVQTLNLFKNDRPLSKDGRAAVVTSNPQSEWAPFVGSQNLVINVDNTGPVTYIFTDTDFINHTGFSTLNSTNSLASWATVFNARITGVTTVVASGGLTLRSNKGNSASATIAITACNLVTNGMFSIPSTETALESTGLDNDYTLDRNRGEIFLETPLSAGDTLTIGTVDTRAFIQSTRLANVTLSGNATLWFAVDGNAQIIPTGITDTSTVVIAPFALTPPDATHVRVRITVTPTVAGGVFSNVQVGDWIIFQDPAFNTSNQGAWRVSLVDTSAHAYVEIVRPTLASPETITMSTNGLVIVRTGAYLQRVTVPSGLNYTATSFAAALAGQIVGASVEVFKTNFLRVRTNTEGPNGDIALVAASTPDGLAVGLPISSAVGGVTPDAGFVESGNFDYGTPEFTNPLVLAPSTTTQFTVTSASAVNLMSGNQVVFLRDLPDTNSGVPYSRYGNNVGYHSALDSIASDTTVNTRLPVLEEFINKGRFYSASPYSLAANDVITVLLDGDSETKRYSVNTFRRVKPTSSTYGITNSFFDVDNGNQVLTAAFGQTFEFVDFALFMKARTKSHAVGGDTTKTILWRWWTWGPTGNSQLLKYVYPLAANTGVSAFANTTSAVTAVANVSLASGAARTGITVRSTTHIGTIITTSGSNQQITYFLGFPISSAQRTSNVTQITVSFAGTAATDHGLVNGNIVFIKSNNVNFSSGAYSITRIASNAFTYTEVAANQGATPNIGTASYDNAGEATFTGSSVISGDIIYVLPASGINHPELAVPGKSNALGAQFWSSLLPTSLSTGTVVGWGLLNNPNYLTAYPLNGTANQAVNIASSVNTLAALANSISPVTAVAVGSGGINTGIVSFATYEDTDVSSNAAGYTFTDGVQYIRSETQPGTPTANYTLTFKDGVTSSLATNSDWSNEDCRLIPQTIINQTGWFNTPGVTGLFSSAEIVASSRGSKLQFTTLTAGSGGSVQVQGGTANTATASAVSSATVVSTSEIVTVRTADTTGFIGKGWFELINASPTNKPVFTSTTVLSDLFTNSNAIATPNVANQGVLQTVGNLWTFTNGGPVTNIPIQFEHQGKYTVLVFADITGGTPFSTLNEGDWIVITAGSTVPVTSSRNIGTFRVVRTNSTECWIENTNSVEEISFTTVSLVSGSSVMPGDIFTLNSNSYGINNAGIYTIVASYTASIGGVSYATATTQIVVSPAFPTSFTGPATLGSDSTLFQITAPTPTKYTKQLLTMTPNPLDGSLTDLKFSTNVGSLDVNPVFGTVVSALDKLNFNTNLSTGTDAYAHAIGLIGAVNQKAYGDETNPTQFPGIIAAGANVNIQGPLVHRIQVSLAIRVFTGVNVSDIIDQVKTAVAQFVNNTPVGQSIAISELVSAAQAVNGVQAVSVVSPTYNSSNDTISIQPQEKALVLNVDTDVTVSLVS